MAESSSHDVIVTVNGKSSVAGSQITTKAGGTALQVLTTTTLSPVEKTSISLTLKTDIFTGTKSDVQGLLINREDRSLQYKLRTTSYDSSTGVAAMKYPGALRGTYTFYVKDPNGNSLSEGKEFVSDSTMTGVTP